MNKQQAAFEKLRISRIGERFNRLTIVNIVGLIKYNRNLFEYQTKCDCGNLLLVSYRDLKHGRVKSCGCYKSEYISGKMKKHGHSMVNSLTYVSWQSMIRRCVDSKLKCYKNYGGRGITVCKEWKNSYEKFYSDMGERTSLSFSLDRIDNNLGYFKENCRWATRATQNNNRRKKIDWAKALTIITFKDTKNIELGNHFGVIKSYIAKIKKGGIEKPKYPAVLNINEADYVKELLH